MPPRSDAFRRLASATIIALGLLAGAARAQSVVPAARVAALIPDGPVTVDILTPKYTPKMQDYSRRLINAAQRDPKWFQAWVAQHPTGALPWHPNLGLTQAEYQDYLREGKASTYEVRSRGRLTFQRAGHAPVWRLSGWGPLQALDGLTLDLQNNQVISPRWGILPGMGISQPTDPNVPLAWRWYGVFKAEHRMGNPGAGGQAMQASLHVGPLGDAGLAGLYWSARRFNGGRKLADEFLLIRFPARR